MRAYNSAEFVADYRRRVAAPDAFENALRERNPYKFFALDPGASAGE